ncbi:MAG: hypothetical protein GC192_20180 [Bacteroidetes bacterium]|nr:hypothetical protein [Bacteroidota bacterium]
MKNSIFFLLFFSFLFVACGEKKAPATETSLETAADLTIVPGDHVGLVTAETCSREGILAAYGKDAKVDSVYLGEGIVGEGVVIFPYIARQRMEVYWDNEIDAKRPAFMRIYGDSTGSDWKTAEGITIGTLLSTVRQINGKDFNVGGFGWDYGGYVMDWNGGKLNAALSLRFEPSEDNPGAEKVQGEGSFNSDLPEMAAANPKVSVMELRFLAKEKLPDCIMKQIENNRVAQGRMVVYKMTVNGSDHYWLQSGAAAYDGIEFIYDANCKEVCKTGGMRKPLDCMKAYENGKWGLVWEE